MKLGTKTDEFEQSILYTKKLTLTKKLFVKASFNTHF